jgi:hypothetical protein
VKKFARWGHRASNSLATPYESLEAACPHAVFSATPNFFTAPGGSAKGVGVVILHDSGIFT